MIDSSASFHFIYEIGDFVEYQPIVILIPIQTVNNITYVTGLDTIIISVLTDKGHPYTVCLYPVLLCEAYKKVSSLDRQS